MLFLTISACYLQRKQRTVPRPRDVTCFAHCVVLREEKDLGRAFRNVARFAIVDLAPMSYSMAVESSVPSLLL